MRAGAKAGEMRVGTAAVELRGTTGATTAPPAAQEPEVQGATTGDTAVSTAAGTEEAEEVSEILETGGVTAGAATTVGPGTADAAATGAASLQEGAGLVAGGAAADRPAPP